MFQLNQINFIFHWKYNVYSQPTFSQTFINYVIRNLNVKIESVCSKFEGTMGTQSSVLLDFDTVGYNRMYTMMFNLISDQSSI